MERYNSFNLIHKGLRAALFQTALQLQQTDFSNDAETEQACNKVKEIVMLFEGHAHKEDSFVLPAISEYEPSVVAAFEAEHETDEKLGAALNDCVARLEAAATTVEKSIVGRALTESFIAFMVFNLEHMAKEEDIINKVLWRYYSDDEIRVLTSKIAQSTPPWMMDFYSGWMLRGISNPEAVTWMRSIQKNLPPVAFQTLLQKAEQVLPVKRFGQLTQSLTEGVQIA